MRGLNNTFDRSNEFEEQATMPLAGGLLQYGYQCGMIWGAALASGTQAYRMLGPGPQAETLAVRIAGQLVASYHKHKNKTNCIDITGLDKSSSNLQMTLHFFVKGGVFRCGHMAIRYTREAFGDITEALSTDPGEPPDPPVSCAALLAEKMGVSERHMCMVAGFAGGIGLSGGACGALGAALWLLEMKRLEAGTDAFDFNDGRGQETIDRFLRHTDNEFECRKIVGRTFQTVHEHAAFLCDGGCAALIEMLTHQNT